MPIYEYRCTECGHEFEVLHKIGERRRRKCEKCSGKLEKLISRTSFHLKGGGWYDSGYTKGTDSSTKPATKDSAKDSKSPSSATEKKDATKKKDAKKAAAV